MASITARRQPSAGSQAALAPLRPQLPGKNLHVCVLNPAGLVPRQGAFANPQVDDLQGFGLLSLAELRRKHASFFRASRTKGARNSPSQVRMPAPGAAPPSARSIRPTMPQAPATSSPSRPSACGPWPQCPRHLRIPYRRTPVTHRLPHTAPPCTRGFPRNCMQCNLVPHSFQPSAPSTYGIQPTAPQAPAASGSPFATQRASLHTWFPTQLCAMQPSSARFPAYRPHGRGLPNAPPLAPAVSHTAPRAFAAC